MYYIDKKFLRDLLKDQSRAMVGKLCNQNEILQKDKDISGDKKLELLKSFNKELIYQSFRDIENYIKCYNNGKYYEKYKIYKPTDSK